MLTRAIAIGDDQHAARAITMALGPLDVYGPCGGGSVGTLCVRDCESRVRGGCITATANQQHLLLPNLRGPNDGPEALPHRQAESPRGVPPARPCLVRTWTYA